MATMITYGAELLRISTKDERRLEVSTDGGRNWNQKGFLSATQGTFLDLEVFGTTLYAVTTEGVYICGDKHYNNWNVKCKNGVSTGDFLSLMVVGDQLMANTTKGLYYSPDKGYNWRRK